MRLMLASLDLPGNNMEMTVNECLLSKYVLMSYYYIDKNINDKIVRIVKAKNEQGNFLLDSGAFTLFTSNKKQIDFEAYLDKYIEYINTNDIKYFIELDIDAVVGYERVLKMRHRLERETGKKCLPVWHKSRGMQAFKEIVRDYDYICIGGLGNKEIKKSEYPQVKKMVRYANAHKTKVHGLAFTRKDAYQYGFYSVDSSAWTGGVRFAQAHVFKNGQIYTQGREQGQRANADLIQRYNFFEWLKFQQYVDKKGVF